MKKIVFIIFAALVISSCMKTVDVYTITTESNDITMGTVTGGGTYIDGSTVTLTATPNPGYRFERWDDGYNNTENPRRIIVHRDATYTAVFKNNTSVVIRDMYQTYKPNYFTCKIDVATKEMTFVSSISATSSDMMTCLRYRWDGPIISGIYSGQSDINFATAQVSNGWGGFYEEIDLEASQISLGNPCLWYLSNPNTFITIGNETIGNWMDKRMTLRITSIDLDAKLVSFMAEATIGNLNGCIQSNSSWDDAATASFSITANDIPIIIQ